MINYKNIISKADKALKSPYILRLANIILFSLVICAMIVYIVTAFYREVNLDASYYLGSVELIYKGLIPVRDFQLAYTPFSFYFLQPFRWLMAEPNYSFYLLIYYVLIIASSFILFSIVRIMTKNTVISRLTQLYFLLIVYLYDGTYIVLEPFVVFFGLWSFLILIQNRKNSFSFFVSGLFSGIAFMSKQYGLAIVAGNLLYILFSDSDFLVKIKRSFFVSIGFIVLPLYFVFYLLMNNVELKQIYDSFFGGGYGQKDLNQWLSGLYGIFNIKQFPTVLLFALVFSSFKKNNSIPVLVANLSVFVLFSLQFYFQVYPHYYILLFPSLLILYSMLYKTDRFEAKVLFFSILLLLTAYSGKKVVFRTISLINSNSRIQQYKRVNEFVPFVNDKETIYCLGVKSLPYYFLLNKKPSLYLVYGYQFGFESKEQILERIISADALVIDKDIADELIEKKDKIGRAISGYSVMVESNGVLVLEKNSFYDDRKSAAFYLFVQRKKQVERLTSIEK